MVGYRKYNIVGRCGGRVDRGECIVGSVRLDHCGRRIANCGIALRLGMDGGGV